MESLDTAVDPNFDYMYKILIVGNSGVGKTAFLVRYCDETFSPSFVATVGIDFKVKTLFRCSGLWIVYYSSLLNLACTKIKCHEISTIKEAP